MCVRELWLITRTLGIKQIYPMHPLENTQRRHTILPVLLVLKFNTIISSFPESRDTELAEVYLYEIVHNLAK